MTISSTRRGFIAGSAGLVLSMTLPLGGARAARAAGAPFAPNAFVRIGTDDIVTVMIKHLEMGQGPYTGLSTLVAEELDADWAQIRAAGAPADEPYLNTALGVQGTGGSTSMLNSYMQMRQAGATARAMLIAAAAREWGVPAAEITISQGLVSHAASGRSSGFGALAQIAATLPVPENAPLKDAKDFVFIGKDRPRLDTLSKIDGSAKFTLDHYPEDALVVLVAHAPKFGAKLKSFDDSASLAVTGVEMVRPLSNAVAVYARNTWAAMQGRDALVVEWDEAEAETRSSVQMFEEYRDLAAAGGLSVEEKGGELAPAFAQADKVLEAEFRFPYLAHAPLETLDMIIEIRDGKAELTYGCQFPTVDRMAFAGVFGLEPKDVAINVLMSGGSFGRRAQGSAHFAIEAAEVAKAAGRDGAFKLMWTREDDIRGGHFRPMALHRMRSGLDKDGRIAAWENVIATQSIMMGTAMEPTLNGGPDPFCFEGSAGLAYDLGARRIGWARAQNPVSVLWWRSVGHTHTAFAVESFLDETLEAAGKDPIEGRLELLSADAVRERAVIEKVREISGWKGRKADGKGYGFAYVKSFGTHVAQVVEVTDVDGMPRATRVWCAVDCGVAVNPNLIRAQMEGGIGFALGTALYSEITFAEGGEVEQSNFHDYPLLRINEMPAVEVAIIESTEAPSGVGEPGVPPLAPALGNAWRALTGKAQHSLPFASVLD